MSNINGVFKTKFRPINVECLQFTGKNGKDVIEFGDGNSTLELKNGGTYIRATWQDGSTTSVKKGAVFIREDDRLYFYDLEDFRANFVVPKSFVSAV